MLRLVFPVLLLAAPALAQTPELVPGDIIVKWREGVRHRGVGQPVVEQRAVGQATLLRLARRTRQATRRVIAALRSDPRVAWVQPNYIRRPFAAKKVPNDKHYAKQWSLRAVRLEQAWARVSGNPNAVVAIVDTGYVPHHPDLASRLVQGFDFISNPSFSGDGDGWDMHPIDEGTESPQSSRLHGTHIAGIVGALTNNGTGIAGVDWACRVQPVRVLGVVEGKGEDADIAAGIRWAAGLPVNHAPMNPRPARVINLSFGGAGDSQVLREAVRDAVKAGTIVVAAAGNQAGSASNIFPAALPEVITVGATSSTGQRASYSNHGAVLDVMAPGGDPNTAPDEWSAGLLSTYYSSQKQEFAYQVLAGTSQAAPMVAGIVSLMLAINPSLDAAEAKRILSSTANPVAQCPEGCGGGLVDADRALAATQGHSSATFNHRCQSDAECPGGICGLVQGQRICTQPCPCPAGASCVGGLCAPVGTSLEAAAGGEVWGGGCAMGGDDLPAGGALLLLLLLAISRACGPAAGRR